MSDTPTKEAVQVAGTPCITIAKFTSAFAHTRTPLVPAARLRSRTRLCLPVAGTRPQPHAHVRAGHLEMRARSPRLSAAFPREISTFSSKGGDSLLSGALLPGRGRGTLRGPAGARRDRAARPAERLHHPRPARLRGCGGSRGGHGHGLCCGYNSRDTRTLPQMHTRSPKSPFGLLVVLQIRPCLYIHLSIYICR